MNVLYFNPVKQQPEGGSFDNALMELMRTNKIAMCQTMSDLFEKLRSQEDRPDIAILCVNDKLELKSLVELSGLLADILIVLFLPSQNEEILTLAHRLRPRFIDFWGYGTAGAEAVLRKMLPTESRGS